MNHVEAHVAFRGPLELDHPDFVRLLGAAGFQWTPPHGADPASPEDGAVRRLWSCRPSSGWRLLGTSEPGGTHARLRVRVGAFETTPQTWNQTEHAQSAGQSPRSYRGFEALLGQDGGAWTCLRLSPENFRGAGWVSEVAVALAQLLGGVAYLNPEPTEAVALWGPDGWTTQILGRFTGSLDLAERIVLQTVDALRCAEDPVVGTATSALGSVLQGSDPADVVEAIREFLHASALGLPDEDARFELDGTDLALLENQLLWEAERRSSRELLNLASPHIDPEGPRGRRFLEIVDFWERFPGRHTLSPHEIVGDALRAIAEPHGDLAGLFGVDDPRLDRVRVFRRGDRRTFREIRGLSSAFGGPDSLEEPGSVVARLDRGRFSVQRDGSDVIWGRWRIEDERGVLDVRSRLDADDVDRLLHRYLIPKIEGPSRVQVRHGGRSFDVLV